VAALLAVGCDLHRPVVTRELATWAIQFVERDISVISRRFEMGNIGSGGGKQIFDIKQLVKKYRAAPPSHKVNFPRELWEYDMIPDSYISQRLANTKAFKDDKSGAIPAIKRVIGSLKDCGILVDMDQGDIRKRFKGFNGKVYRIDSKYL